MAGFSKTRKRAKVGTKFSFGNGKLIGEVVDLSDEGSRIIKFHYDGIFEEILDELGNMPLPPYITARLDEKKDIRLFIQSIMVQQQHLQQDYTLQKNC